MSDIEDNMSDKFQEKIEDFKTRKRSVDWDKLQQEVDSFFEESSKIQLTEEDIEFITDLDMEMDDEDSIEFIADLGMEIYDDDEF